ncbi:MAG: ABC transporter permease [Trueperella sp.]|nr:ABC transporter permease [Trueperella sp.]
MSTSTEQPPRPALARFAPPLGLIALTLILWELVVQLANIPLRILPAPSRILTAALADLPNLLPATAVTAGETLTGFVLAVVSAVVISFLLWLFPLLNRAASPLLVISQTIPIIAIAPLMVIWFGFEASAKVLLVALFAFFPIAVSLQRGLQSITQEQVDVATSLGASPFWILTRLRSRAALPSFLTGIRIAVTYAPATAATAEFVGARRGVGIYLLSAQASYRTDLVFAGAIMLTLLTLLLWLLVSGLERLVMRHQ